MELHIPDELMQKQIALSIVTIATAEIEKRMKLLTKTLELPPYGNKETINDDAVIKYGDLPHDLDFEKNKNRYNEYMDSLILNREISTQMEQIVSHQKSFIQEISFESKFSNSEVNNATITI
ncbi:hypothetical protein ACOJB1_11745 [Enterococcus innesii]|uniref:hypothetical protein n=1 Tax=Enterococcus innesii TaxID=2839759 RepID=UPI003B5B2266